MLNSFTRAKTELDQTEQAKLVAFGSTRRKQRMLFTRSKALLMLYTVVESRPRLTLASDGYLASDAAGTLDYDFRTRALTAQTMIGNT
jgi:hypothetical protein